MGPADRLAVYSNNYFGYSYSIGSLEHFTEDGILKFISEVDRITKYGTFHMMPVSRNSQNQGWIKRAQSYFNNSEQWWLKKFKTKYANAYAIDSGWDDDISVGKWFVCINNNE